MVNRKNKNNLWRFITGRLNKYSRSNNNFKWTLTEKKLFSSHMRSIHFLKDERTHYMYNYTHKKKIHTYIHSHTHTRVTIKHDENMYINKKLTCTYNLCWNTKNWKKGILNTNLYMTRKVIWMVTNK